MSAAQLALMPTDAARAMPTDGTRIAGDAYYTPGRLARTIVQTIHAIEPISGGVLEPSVGGGAFARALLDITTCALTVIDIDPEAPGLKLSGEQQRQPVGSWIGKDFLTLSAQPPQIYRWVIGNPRYDVAEAHVRHALSLSQRHVVFLLRSAFAESAGRIPFWSEHPCRHEWRLAQRPSFTACGRTDSAAYSVFWWDREHTGPSTCTHGWDWQQPTPTASWAPSQVT